MPRLCGTGGRYGGHEGDDVSGRKDTGTGNYHRHEMKKKLEKALITVDGVTQYPLMYTPLSYTLANNTSNIIMA